eukprot:8690527-Pyramimonas_sp.AAC.1
MLKSQAEIGADIISPRGPLARNLGNSQDTRRDKRMGSFPCELHKGHVGPVRGAKGFQGDPSHRRRPPR